MPPSFLVFIQTLFTQALYGNLQFNDLALPCDILRDVDFVIIVRSEIYYRSAFPAAEMMVFFESSGQNRLAVPYPSTKSISPIS